MEGLCGNFDGNSNNEFSSVQTANAQEFGNKWKTSAACPEMTTQYTGSNHPCQVNSERNYWAEEQCGVIMKGDLFEACRMRMANPSLLQMFYENCRFDACGCDQGGDCECMCTAIASFAEECNKIGIYVKWRSNHLCRKFFLYTKSNDISFLYFIYYLVFYLCCFPYRNTADDSY